MRALHECRFSLIRQAGEENDMAAVSICVNPKQFNNPADSRRYPRALERDKGLIAPYADYASVVVEIVWKLLQQEQAITIEYVATRDADTFQPVNKIEHAVVILAATDIRDVRLMDNMVVIIKNHAPPHR